MLTLPPSTGATIKSFSVYRHYFLAKLLFDPAFMTDDGKEHRSGISVYHRKSGARLLCLPLNTKSSVRQLVSLKQNLDLLINFDAENLNFWVLSGSRTSRLVTKPLAAAKPEQDCYLTSISNFALLKEKNFANIYLNWFSNQF